MTYTLLISEKPQAAQRIAQALAENKVKKHTRYGAYWLEFERKGKKHICVPAVGHLFVLNTKKGSGWNYPTFDLEWVPTSTQKGSEFTKKYYKNIEKVVKDADSFIIATDYDTEGEVIGFNILRFLCNKKDAKRMKFSTLTKTDLVEAYENVLTHIDFGQVEAGLTRHFLDAYWGFNTTRALTLAMKQHLKNAFIIVSSGRVQSPTLHILAEREIEIKKFIPVPFWQLELHCLIDSKELVALYEQDKIWKKEEAKKIFEACKGKDAVVKGIEKREYKQLPPFPFNTTALQTESYNYFKFSPKHTMSIAEGLYNAGVISYPRTSSQKLPAKIDYKKILKKLSKIGTVKKHCEQLLSKKDLKPREGLKTDPAHPAIYPTGEIPKTLTDQQKKLYSLILRRFLATFGDPAIREGMKVVLNINGFSFILTGKRTIEPGWVELYGEFARFKEQILPELKQGQVLSVKELLMLDKETQPPKRYTQGSIVKEMEKRGLGTRATRANILQTLYNRGYIKGKQIEVTEFGEKVADVLGKNCPKIVSEELTKKFEQEMELIREDKKKRKEVVSEAKEMLIEILNEFKQKQDKIGEVLSKAYISFKRNQKVIGKCPNCGNDLRIVTSKKSGKRFIGCSNYPKCKRGYPLPQYGKIIALSKACKECGLPMIKVFSKGKRSYTMCIDPKCKSKENWGNKSK